MNKFLLFIVAFSLLACQEKQTQSPRQLLEKVAEKNGKNVLYNGTLSFEHKATQYSAERNGNEYRYSMLTVKNNSTYEAISYNGGFEYLIDGQGMNVGGPVEQTEKQLVATIDFMMVPQLFLNDNSAQLTLKTPVIIDQKKYQVVHVYYKDLMPTDLVQNFNLYINEENSEIDFIGYDFRGPTGTTLFFREAFNNRVIEGVTFSNYRTYDGGSNETSLDILPQLFMQNQLVLRSAFSPENVKVVMKP